MNIYRHLSELRKAIPDCHLAAFIDLNANMVMAHEARSKPPQERLDGLADQAERLLKAPGMDGPIDHVLIVSGENLEVFGKGAADGVAMVCGLDTSVEKAVQHGKTWLEQLQHEGIAV